MRRLSLSAKAGKRGNVAGACNKYLSYPATEQKDKGKGAP